jgi:hypothetical protein
LSAAASAPDVEGYTIDLGTGHLTPVHEIVRMTVEAVGPTTGRPLFGHSANGRWSRRLQSM